MHGRSSHTENTNVKIGIIWDMLVPQQSGGKIADKHLFVQSPLLSHFAVNVVCKPHINNADKLRNLGGRQEVESLCTGNVLSTTL